MLQDFFKQGDSYQTACLRTVETYWEKSHSHVLGIFDRLVRRGLISFKTLAKYIGHQLVQKSDNLQLNSLYIKILKASLRYTRQVRRSLEHDPAHQQEVAKLKTDLLEGIITAVEVSPLLIIDVGHSILTGTEPRWQGIGWTSCVGTGD